MTQMTILLLAAGQSRRMGDADKLMEPVDGMPLIRRSALMARAVAPVVVTLPSVPHPRYGALDGLDVAQVAVPNATEGMNAGLTCGLNALPPGTQAVMILLADLPDLSIHDLERVAQAVDLKSNTRIWRGATQDGLPGHPVVFHHALFAELAALKGDVGARPVIRAHLDLLCLIPLPGQAARTDLDTPELWRTWRAANLDR
ncbi:MAG: nucleotidyltransferase family protein [Rhodobacteraceae bacterium]|nr:nucleotidyltransferase family protein [Paracoccaceae bacterium]